MKSKSSQSAARAVQSSIRFNANAPTFEMTEENKRQKREQELGRSDTCIC